MPVASPSEKPWMRPKFRDWGFESAAPMTGFENGMADAYLVRRIAYVSGEALGAAVGDGCGVREAPADAEGDPVAVASRVADAAPGVADAPTVSVKHGEFRVSVARSVADCEDVAMLEGLDGTGDVVGMDACALGVRTPEYDGRGVGVGRDATADGDAEGAADGDDMTTTNAIGLEEGHQPVCVVHSTSPVE